MPIVTLAKRHVALPRNSPSAYRTANVAEKSGGRRTRKTDETASFVRDLQRTHPLKARIATAHAALDPTAAQLGDILTAARSQAEPETAAQTSFVSTAMLPWVAREYGHTWCAASTRRRATSGSMPGRLTLRRTATS
jgi:hypothetical protein